MKKLVGLSFILLEILCFCNCSYKLNNNIRDSFSDYENASEYQRGNFSYNAYDVYEEISIDWINGKITLVETGEDILRVTENSENLTEDEKVHYLIENGKMSIQYAKAGYSQKIDEKYKEIVIEVPKKVKITIHTMNTNIEGDILQPSELEIIGVSTNIHIHQLYANVLNTNFVSGEIQISNLLTGKLNVMTTSAKIDIGIIGSINGEIHTDSGDVHLKVKEDLGVKIDFTSMVGHFNSLLPFTNIDSVHQLNSSSEVFIKMNSTSGNMNVEVYK